MDKQEQSIAGYMGGPTLHELGEAVEKAYAALTAYLTANLAAGVVSPQLRHHATRMADVLGAIHAEELWLTEREARQAYIEAQRARRDRDRQFDAHTKSMADRFGITPEEFLAHQEWLRAPEPKSAESPVPAMRELMRGRA